MTTTSTDTEQMADAEQPGEGGDGLAAQRIRDLLGPDRIDALLADAEAAGEY